MAKITISNLPPAGYDLFSDSESFMSNLSEAELAVQGGGTPVLTAVVLILILAEEAR